MQVVTENEDLFVGSEEAPKDAEERASRFLISFLQQALFEQFSTTEEEDSNILRSKQIAQKAKSPCDIRDSRRTWRSLVLRDTKTFLHLFYLLHLLLLLHPLQQQQQQQQQQQEEEEAALRISA
ncbi:hypothetical protein, conserved [Eimeria praecox]|uniref:Uncharacterized protein n=1 Tax=Eimeria praecox TaxID=51316 RepID=U6G2V0_9EIME|nr:hypothetical protein, conserved [Eimeria praecox]